MKKYISLLSISLLFACSNANQEGENQSDSSKPYSENQLENLQISLDTVRVDVGDEIINATAYYGFGLSEDNKTIYFADGMNTEVHAYNLPELKLERRIAFEKDGPNQAPSFINFFQVLPNGEFLLASYNIQAVFNDQAEKVLNIKALPEEYDGLDESLSSLYGFIHVSPDKKLAISRPIEYRDASVGLAMMDIENKTGQMLPLPELEITKKFRSSFSQGGGTTTMGDNVTIQEVRNQLVIYSASTADIYIYDWNSKELKLIEFEHQLVPNQKSGDFPSEAGTREELMEIAQEIRSQVSFMGFLWDESRQQYFRFAVKQNGFLESGEPKKADWYLFSYDENFNLLGETKLDQLNNFFYQSFFYDGKIYNYLPVEEDPGFVIMTLNF
ncbi:DUF4221 domain-containing protein [Algoriphagus kandeliae]|uniref:DUF4221 domain-containing protein n=1 Tax=Algoriphagus kandeliae TaxID=2562278 RepID=A0A4Y9QUI8_9BACT|nr:DUF4221 family protein [Algoriphagus kandeliae]TFV95750.1 DUF4221 domain-containing protein [Algoriphagus kandeliae]